MAIPSHLRDRGPDHRRQAGTLVADGTTFINTAHLSGTYAGTVYDTGPQTSTVTGKYAIVAKSGAPGIVGYGTVITYSIAFDLD